MTQVDFYLLGEGGRRELIACRLVEKAYRLGHRVYLFAPDRTSTAELDDLLWTFSQGSFVPHALYTGASPEADEQPVLIGHDEPPAGFDDVLVSLAGEVPAWYSRFARVAELVGADEQDKLQARERFRFYREHGSAPATHNL